MYHNFLKLYYDGTIFEKLCNIFLLIKCEYFCLKIKKRVIEINVRVVEITK